jgi:hypothetical protein
VEYSDHNTFKDSVFTSPRFILFMIINSKNFKHNKNGLSFLTKQDFFFISFSEKIDITEFALKTHNNLSDTSYM